MFLSILIPTHNYICAPLVAALVEQASRLPALQYEIIVADDGSTRADVLAANRAINSMPCAEYWEFGENVGRSAARNRLFSRSRGSHLLFLDSDGLPASSAFLGNYLAALAQQPTGVLCGGIVHPAQLPSPAVSLRWRYEKKAEQRLTREWRNAHPYLNFRSFNFLVDRATFSSILFDEKIRHYGFEDNLFGEELRLRAVPVLHIDNPMVNIDIEPNALYVKKNEEALRTLASHYSRLAPLVRISGFVGRVERLHLGWLLSFVYSVLRPLLLRNLCGSHPSVSLLNFYKAGYLRSLLVARKQG